MRVVDASAMYHLVLNTTLANEVADHLDDDLFAPDLMPIEVLNRVAGLARGGVISNERADEAVGALQDADVEYLPTWPHLAPMWSMRHNVSAFDASYVVLADDLRCPLVTSDARLARAVGHRITVLVVGPA